MNLRRLKLFPLLVGFLATGCGGDSPADPGGGGPGGTPRVILANPSFATNINEIFQRNGCSAGSCHGAAGGQMGLMLTSSASANYGMLVGVAAQSEVFDRVAAGDPVNSYLMIKLEGRQTVGGRMPLNGVPLDGIDMSNLTNWITNGAPNN